MRSPRVAIPLSCALDFCHRPTNDVTDRLTRSSRVMVRPL